MSTSASLSLHRSFALFVTFALALGLLAPMVAPPRVGAASIPVINEFSASTTGDDVEYLELYADPGTDLTGYVVLEIEGDAGLTVGVIDQVLPIAGTTDTSGLLLVDLTANTIENGSVSLLLVGGFTGAVGTDLDMDDDGAIDVAPWSSVVDSIAVSDGGSGDATYGTTTLRPNYDGLSSYAPGGASRIPNGTDTDTAADWVRNDFDLAGIPGFAGTPVAGEALNTPGAVNKVATTEPPASPDAVINEFSASTTGTDVEYVELFADASTDLSSLTILEIEGDATAVGTVDEVIGVGTTDSHGLWLRNLAANALENGTLTLLLVRDFTGAAGNDLDTNDDGTLDVTPWAEIVDAVAVNDGGADDRTYGSPVLGVSYDGLSFAPGGASRIPDGTDTNTSADWVRNDFDLAGIPGFAGSIADGEAYNTPGASNAVYAAPPPSPIGACADPATLISAVQGSGTQSPVVGTQVVVEGIVVGDFQYGSGSDSGDLGGFFLQEEDADADAEPLTSEGIFVYDPNGTEVQVGDQVRVGGAVAEFGSGDSKMTELTNVIGLQVCASGATLPTATQVSLPVTAVSDFERHEGMLVTFPQALTISEYFNFDRYNEVVLTNGRQFQPTALADPGSPEAAATAAANRLGRITLDDGRTSQNPVPLRHPDGSEFTLDHRFRGGDTVQDVTGVIEDSFGLYRIQPTAGAEYTAQNPRPAAPADVGGRLEVASFNVLNYFTTLDTDVPVCGPLGNQDCRGANTPEELERQRAKIVAALATMSADVVGLMEIENHPGDVPTADLVAGLNEAVGAGTYAYVETGAIGSDAIRVALIYRPGSVTPVGDFAILDSTIDPRFDDEKSRPALAQTFAENATGAAFTVVVNHLKSKSSNCGGAPDDDPEQGNCNLTRTLAAQALVDWVASDPTGAGDVDALIMGDLNAYDHEDPITAIRVGADDTAATGDEFTDLVREYAGEEAYSYAFNGQLGYLDTALASPTIRSQVTGATIWHINADEPDILDYDMSFKPAGQEALYAPDPYRSSDHDPVIVGLELRYDFVGFAPPVFGTEPSDVTAGRALPLKFSLGGDFGLGVLFEVPQVFACDAYPLAESQDALSRSGLTYDPEEDQYVFVWKTLRDWAGECRVIELTFVDGTVVTLEVAFAEGSAGPKAARS